jgi:hypothetical protein
VSGVLCFGNVQLACLVASYAVTGPGAYPRMPRLDYLLSELNGEL